VVTLVVVALTLLPHGAVLASNSDSQVVSGNVETSLSINTPESIENWNWQYGDNYDDDDDIDNAVHCYANTGYQVTIRCDITDNKTGQTMWEWNGTGYIQNGESLRTMTMVRTNGSDWGPVSSSDNTIPGFSSMVATPDEGDITYIDFKQAVDYGDSRLGNGHVYMHRLTYTISEECM